MARLDNDLITFDNSNDVEPVSTKPKRVPPNKITHDEFVAKAAKSQPNIKILGQYINSKTKILCQCCLCDREWELQPNTILNGKGCLWCAGIKITHDEFVKRIANLHPSIKVIGQYVASAENVLCECQTCGLQWPVLPSTLYDGKGCLRCSGSYRRNHQEFIDDLAQINPTIEVVGDYKDTKTHVECRCRDCGHSWQAVPRRLLAGRSCPECAKKKIGDAARKTHDTFVKEIYELLPSVEVISRYEGWDKHVQCRCKTCGHEWKIIPYYLRHSDGCPECVRKKNGSKVYSRKIDPEREKARREKLAATQRKSHEQFLREAEAANPKIAIIGTYVHVKQEVDCQCKRCGHVWSMLPCNIMKSRGCPECSKQQTSCFERYILFSLQKHLGEANVLSRDKSAISKELDVYIPNLNVALEPGRWFWHKRKFEKDKEKYELCKRHGIELITIYDEFDEDRDALELNDDFITYPYKLGGHDKKDELVLCVKEIFNRLELPYTFSNDEEDILFTMAKMSTSRKSTDEVIAELVQIHDNIELLSDYQDVKTKMRCRCTVCGKEFESNYDHLIRRKQGCPECYRSKNKVINLDTGEIFDSATAAANSLGISKNSVAIVCRGRNQTCAGHHWSYLSSLSESQLSDLRTKFPDTFKY